MGGERVLETVEIVIQDSHFAIELVVEGLGGGGIAVHCLENGWRNVCWTIAVSASFIKHTRCVRTNLL